MKKYQEERHKSYFTLFIIVGAILLLFLSTGYAALNSELGISGDAYVRVNSDIRISNLAFIEATNGAYETYKTSYSKNTTSIDVTLPKKDSTITYEVSIKNSSATNRILKDIIVEANSNDSIKYKIDDIAIGDEIPACSTQTFRITFYIDSVLDNPKTSIILRYKFIEKPSDPNHYSESILNGADPVISSGLVPVTIADDGTVTMADISQKWYSYKDKNWANAVILENTDEKYQQGDIIPEDHIQSYFVWIPRYKYKIFNDGNYQNNDGPLNPSAPHAIQLIFETNRIKASTGTTVGSWLTHPAFTAFDANGMWVGKFETGFQGVSSPEDQIIPSRIQIKANTQAWTSIRVAYAFQNSYLYQRQLDSHMMKNTEWGAVAYLHHSIYGSNQNIRFNNNSSSLSGYASVKEPTCGNTGKSEACNTYSYTSDVTLPYNTSTGYLASTTANISGIYDMSGGSYEYVMGFILDQDGNLTSGSSSKMNSGFNGVLSCPTCNSDTSGITEITNGLDFPERRYYDTYAYSHSLIDYKRRILGDATGEMGPFMALPNYTVSRIVGSWYQDQAHFVTAASTWVIRGGSYSYGIMAGIFAYTSWYGNASSQAFRIVLTP